MLMVLFVVTVVALGLANMEGSPPCYLEGTESLQLIVCRCFHLS